LPHALLMSFMSFIGYVAIGVTATANILPRLTGPSMTCTNIFLFSSTARQIDYNTVGRRVMCAYA
jgi:hypothetical protein